MAAAPAADALTARLQACTQRKLAAYGDLLAGRPAPKFWDLVVLTATDEDQAAAYRAQLEMRRERKLIPDAVYEVIADPPGPKIGNGGATMHALEQLEKKYAAADLARFCILLMHAGGFSKRLPQVSVVGKIFTTLPMAFGEAVFTMFEINLASYIEFPSHMVPGVFVTCADDIELLDAEGLSFMQPGFTALGHPSPVEIGTTHGVFVLADEARAAAAKALLPGSSGRGDAPLPSCTPVVCSRFLHKFSAEKLASHNAIIPGTETVYTDSAYFLDRQTAVHLLDFYAKHRPLTCEIDAYGDFLQALGPDATDEYVRNTANVISVEDGLTETRMALFRHLKGTPLNVVLCNWSRFYHIGTIAEYLHHYCADNVFAAELGTTPVAFSRVPPAVQGAKHLSVIHSHLGADVEVAPSTVIEYSRLGAGCKVGGKCVLSNIAAPPGTVIPDGLFLHTTAVHGGYVTIFFGTGECLKNKASVDAAPEKLTLCGVALREVLARSGLSLADIFGADAKTCVWWDAALFFTAATAESSLLDTLRFIEAIRSPDGAAPDAGCRKRLDMPEILRTKDLSRILDDQRTLATDIISGTQ